MVVQENLRGLMLATAAAIAVGAYIMVPPSAYADASPSADQVGPIEVRPTPDSPDMLRASLRFVAGSTGGKESRVESIVLESVRDGTITSTVEMAFNSPVTVPEALKFRQDTVGRMVSAAR